MKKITESQLIERARSLRSYLSDAAVVSGDGSPVAAGGGTLQAGAPAAAAPAPAPAAAAPAPAAPAGPANAKEQNYATALQQIKGLYAKAQVPYPPTDKIVQSRYGLPDPLPPLDQWDGTMPKSTGADFLTRNLFGRQASADTAKQQGVNDLSNAGNAKADAAVAADMTKLTDLIGKLKALGASPAQGAKPVDPNAPRLNAAQTADAAAKGMQAAMTPVAGGNGTWSAESINESMSRLLNTVRFLEAEAPTATAGTPPPPAVGTPAAAPAAGEDKASIIKQIQDIMADINAQNENPPQDVIKALSDAQAAIDAANKPTGSAALDGTKPGADPATTIPGGPGTAAGGAGVVPPKKPTTPIGQGPKTGAPNLGKFDKGSGPNNFNQQGASLPAGVKPSTAGAGRGGQGGPTAAQAATATPAPKGSMFNPMNWFKEGEMTEQELVKFKDDQTLARIVDLTRK